MLAGLYAGNYIAKLNELTQLVNNARSFSQIKSHEEKHCRRLRLGAFESRMSEHLDS